MNTLERFVIVGHKNNSQLKLDAKKYASRKVSNLILGINLSNFVTPSLMDTLNKLCFMTQWNFLLLTKENMKLLITFYSLGEYIF